MLTLFLNKNLLYVQILAVQIRIFVNEKLLSIEESFWTFYFKCILKVDILETASKSPGKIEIISCFLSKAGYKLRHAHSSSSGKTEAKRML